MTGDTAPLGLTRQRQLALIGVAGIVLLVLGQLSTSAVDPEYDPLLFGIGFVMVLYAIITAIWDRLRG